MGSNYILFIYNLAKVNIIILVEKYYYILNKYKYTLILMHTVYSKVYPSLIVLSM